MDVGEGAELVDQSFGMDPAQAVLADIELTGIVADDHGVGEKAVGFDTAPQCAFGGDQHRIRIDLECRYSQPVEMGGPGDLIGLKVGTITGSTAETWLSKSQVKVSSYPDVPTAVAGLNSGELKAIVYDAPVLRYYLAKRSGTRLRLVGPTFERQSYGIAIQQDSPLRIPVNRALLALNERGELIAQAAHDMEGAP